MHPNLTQTVRFRARFDRVGRWFDGGSRARTYGGLLQAIGDNMGSEEVVVYSISYSI
jgi:hypothetical protein